MKVNPICPGVFLSDHVPGGHIVPPLCVNPDRKKVLHEIWHSHTLQCYKKLIEKFFQTCSYRDHDVTNHVNFFEKLRRKWLKYVFFSKINLVTARKKIFKIFFQLLKLKITYKLNIYRLIC